MRVMRVIKLYFLSKLCFFLQSSCSTAVVFDEHFEEGGVFFFSLGAFIAFCLLHFICLLFIYVRFYPY